MIVLSFTNITTNDIEEMYVLCTYKYNTHNSNDVSLLLGIGSWFNWNQKRDSFLLNSNKIMVLKNYLDGVLLSPFN